MDEIAIAARHGVNAQQKDRYHPALIDGKPCETLTGLTIFTTVTRM